MHNVQNILLRILAIKQGFNCIKQLLNLKKDLEDNSIEDSSTMFDYYYLLGRAHEKSKNSNEALEALYKARSISVINNVVIITCLQ